MYRTFSTVLLILAAIGALLVPNPMASATIPSRAAPTNIPWTDVNPLGATFFLNREVEPWKRAVTVRMAADAGLGWINQMFPWEEIELRPGVYWNDRDRRFTWEKFDEIVQLAQQQRLHVIIRLDKPPPWALAEPGSPGGPVERVQDFASFVRTVVGRYRGKVQHFQIWNEPNLAAEWGNRNVEPAEYTRLLQAAYRAAKEANPDAVVISAPLAQTLESGPRNLDEISFLEGMYRAGAKDSFDILGANAYGFEYPPSMPPDRGVLNFQRVRLLREVMERYGDEQKPVWFNEFGWNASPATFPASQLYWRRVTDKEQAEYTAEGIRIARQWGWVGVINTWFFRQVGDYPVTDSTYFFRMVDVDFTPRPVFQTVKALGWGLTVAQPGFHEDTSGAVRAGPEWRTQLDGSASAGTLLVGVPGSPMTITFEGSEIAAMVSRTEGVAALRVRLDSISNLPIGADGAKTQRVLLPEIQPGHRARVVIARDLPQGRHTVEVAVDQAECQNECQIWLDAFEVVASSPSYVPFYVALALIGVSIIGLVASILSRRRA